MVGAEAISIKNKVYGLQNWWTEILCDGNSRRPGAMVDPKVYIHQSKTNFKFHSTFADKDENPELPGSDWDLSFSEHDGTTEVSIVIKNESLERMERMIAMGFIEGFTATLNSLEELLSTLSR